MQSWGISTLISDSGVIRYKITAEEWNIYNTTNPPRWTFVKGILLEKFDSTFHIDWFVQSDTAYCHNQQLWELRGRVVIRKPDEFLQGYNFRSNEQMTRYSVSNANAETPFSDSGSSSSNDSVMRAAPTKPNQP